jgi:hypothetical protein
MKLIRLLPRHWPVLLVAWVLSTASLPAAEDAKPGILFLRLRLKDGSISLVSATTAPGMLKTPRGARRPKEFEFVVEEAEGKPVWTVETSDPSVQRLEYADPAHPGVIQVKEVRRTDVEFTVRVPAAPGKRQLVIYRRAGLAGSASQKSETARALVARIALP